MGVSKCTRSIFTWGWMVLVDDWTGGAAYISTDKQSPVLDNIMKTVKLILIETNLSVFLESLYIHGWSWKLQTIYVIQ